MQKIRSRRDIGNYAIDQAALLGKGTYGKIYVAYRRDTESRVACKCISKKSLYSMEMYSREMMKETQKQFEAEINFHFKLNSNKHIVKLYDIEQDEYAYYLFMEECDSDVAKQLKKREKFPQEEAIDLIKQLCIGYDGIYRQKASHRDLKPQNLLLKKGVLKIADFGFVKEIAFSSDSVTRSKIRTQIKDKQYLRASTACGTLGYIPPNAMDSQVHSQLSYDFQKFDMWSIGVIFYYILYGKRPFDGTTPEQICKSIQTKDVVFPDTVVVSQKTKSIILKLLNKNQEERIEFRLLVKQLGIQELEGKKSIGIQKQRNSIQKRGSQRTLRTAKTAQAKLAYLDFLTKLIKQLYTINTKYSFFRKTFKQIPFAYQMMTRLHEQRALKIKYIIALDEYKDALKQLMGKFVAVNTATQEYQKSFYLSIQDLAVTIQGGFGTLDLLLKRFDQVMKSIKKQQINCLDFQILRIVLAILRLKKYTERKLKVESLTEVLEIQIHDHAKLSEWLAKQL